MINSRDRLFNYTYLLTSINEHTICFIYYSEGIFNLPVSPSAIVIELVFYIITYCFERGCVYNLRAIDSLAFLNTVILYFRSSATTCYLEFFKKKLHCIIILSCKTLTACYNINFKSIIIFIFQNENTSSRNYNGFTFSWKNFK